MAQCVRCFCIVVIQAGDTLAAIAAQFGTPGGFQQIACCNNIPNPNVIVPGQVILVPTPCPGPPTAPPCPFSYTVQPGDTLFFIAQRFGVTLQALIAANPQIPDPNLIFPGQVITIPCPTPPPPPPCPFSYTVQPGDTLFFIAQRFGVSLQKLIAANPQIPDPNLIFPGQVITIPCPGDP